MVQLAEWNAETIGIADLDAMDDAALDRLPFGVVAMDADGIARRYNDTEAQLAGLDRERIIGAHFFDTIAQCMNNFMVAQRYEDEPELDAVVPFVLTLRMRPTPVRLRLLQRPGVALSYLLIKR
ncbi:MAG: PAS domain-containing protein [Sphingomonas fennica]